MATALVRTNIEKAFTLFSGRQEGDLVSYQEIEASLGGSLSKVRPAIYPAITRLEKDQGKTLRCSRKQGYVVARMEETFEILNVRKKRSKKQISKAIHTATNVETCHWEASGQKQLQQELNNLHRILAAQNGQIRKLAQTVEREKQIRQKAEEQSQEAFSIGRQRLEAIERRLAQLEQAPAGR